MDIVDLEKNVGKDTTKKGFVTKPVMTTSVWSPLQRKKKRTSKFLGINERIEILETLERPKREFGKYFGM